VDALGGEAATRPWSRWARPTFDVNGIGRVSGRGRKDGAAEPRRRQIQFPAGPPQDPKKVVEALRKFLKSRAPRNTHGARGNAGAPGCLCRSTALHGRASAAIERGFGRAPVFIERVDRSHCDSVP